MKLGMTLLTLLIFGLISVSQAKESTNPNPPLDTPTTSYSTTPAKQLAIVTNAIDYKSMYEVQKGYSSDILSTVYWSLGSILGLLVFFLGSNVFFYYRFNKKGYEKFVAETNERIDEQERVIEKKLEEKNKEYLDELEGSTNERVSIFSESLEKQIKTLEQRIEMVDDKNVMNLESVRSSLIIQIEKLDERVAKDIQDNVNEIKQNHNQSKYDILELEAEIWDLQGVFANSLRKRVRQLEMINKGEVLGWHYEYALRDISDLVKNKKITALYSHDIEGLVKTLKDVPNEYSIEVQDILRIVNSLEEKKL